MEGERHLDAALSSGNLRENSIFRTFISCHTPVIPASGEGGEIHTVELYRKVRLACRDGMRERATLRGLTPYREEDASHFGPAGLPTHSIGAASDARRVYRADRAVAWG